MVSQLDPQCPARQVSAWTRASETFGERGERILGDAVEAYIQSGLPVGSRRLARRGRYGLSAATVRNVLSDLEQEGYLSKPHTSAGRVPTDKGYRFYVNRILARDSVEPISVEGREDWLGRFQSRETLLARASRLLADITHQVGMVLAPNVADAPLKHMEFLAISPRRVLAVFVAGGGLVHHKAFDVPEPYSAEDLQRAGRFLKEEFAGLTLRQMRGRLLEKMAEDRARYDTLRRRALALGQRCLEYGAESSDLYVEGTENLLDGGEIEVEEMRALLAAFEEKKRIVELLGACMARPGKAVFIGTENPDEPFRCCSLVLVPYCSPEGERGALGVVGPTRMEYSKVLGAVSGVAHLVSKAMA
jgi:heat-inducible transcriptional repressor